MSGELRYFLFCKQNTWQGHAVCFTSTHLVRWYGTWSYSSVRRGKMFDAWRCGSCSRTSRSSHTASAICNYNPRMHASRTLATKWCN